MADRVGATDVKALIDELVQKQSGSVYPPGKTSMNITEVGGPTDPLRRIEWPISGLPRGAKIWSQRDPLKGMHHITLEADGLQAHTSVTEQVLATASDINIVAEAIVNDLCAELGITADRETTLKALGLAYWKHLVDMAVREHWSRTKVDAKYCFVTPAVYGYIRDCKDDLAGGGERAKWSRKGDAAARLGVIMPKGVVWEIKKPVEGAFLVSISVK